MKLKSTGFDYNYQDDWSEMVGALCRDRDRNHLLVTDILQATADPGVKSVIISERVHHLEDLKKSIEGSYSEAEIINSKVPDKEREEITRRFDRGKLQILLVTFKSISNIDIKKANHLLVVSPLKYDDLLTQSVGKLLSSSEGEKRPEILDYRDEPELLKVSLRKRLKIYKSLGAEYLSDRDRRI